MIKQLLNQVIANYRDLSVTRRLGPVLTYPEIFVSANFFMRIHLASTRVRRIRSE